LVDDVADVKWIAQRAAGLSVNASDLHLQNPYVVQCWIPLHALKRAVYTPWDRS
jgi:hypothetical protein